MGIDSGQSTSLVERGKYRADEKLGFLDRRWQTGNSGLPEEDRFDAFNRDNLEKWEQAALAGGRRGFLENMRRLAGRTPALAEVAAREPSVVTKLPELLANEVKAGGVARVGELAGLSAPAAIEAMEIFRTGMLEALAYTGDIGEVPSVRALSRIPGPFPSSCLDGVSSALCLFTCAQFGRQDVIHMYKAGIPAVTLVDLNAEKMAHMQRIYRPEWTYETADFRQFLATTISANTRYDLVTADPDIALAPEVTGPCLGELTSVARKTLCLMYTSELLERDGYNSGGLEQMSRSLSKRSGRSLKVVEVMRRANTVYWTVIRLA
jgi:hypothetical protein